MIDKHFYKKPYLIAEIGINHNGLINIAKKIISVSKASGFDAVKFQKRDPDICIPAHQKEIMRETPWGNMSYLAYKKKIEFNLKQLTTLKNYAKKLKLDFFTSCFDINSFKLMNRLNDFNKIPSAMISNTVFLEHVAKKRKKTFISTGMCEMNDVSTAVKIFKKNKCEFELMHCVSLYPCPENKLNLSMIQTLKKKFKCKVGYSGHETSVSPSFFAFMLGATTIERHVTLDRSMWGTDQAASLESAGMRLLGSGFNKINYIIGDGVKNFTLEEQNMLKKFKYW
ncbi:N-acetylneuraminate synthase family protein [Pelagibacteraceae bacterium]|nr:N-acetylneuraminate synthase family protein [Pelagibacteraceae bacterium]